MSRLRWASAGGLISGAGLGLSRAAPLASGGRGLIKAFSRDSTLPREAFASFFVSQGHMYLFL